MRLKTWLPLAAAASIAVVAIALTTGGSSEGPILRGDDEGWWPRCREGLWAT
jgi:hypothetical protein